MNRALVVIAVREEALALSLELVAEAFDLTVHIHDPETGFGGLSLRRDSVLIIDRELLPRVPWGFFRRLRERSWRGVAIVLIEDRAKPDLILAPTDGLVLLEKPFGSRELCAVIRPLLGRQTAVQAPHASVRQAAESFAD